MYISAVASHVPTNSIDNISQAALFSKPYEFISTKIGATTLPRKQNSQDSADLASLALSNLFELGTVSPSDIDVICVVTQNPSCNGIPHTSAALHGEFELKQSCFVFDLSLGCSGFVYGLSILSNILQVQSLSNAILVTSDPYSDIINPEDPNTSLLFGDAATATLITNNPSAKSLKIGKLFPYADGSARHAIQRENNSFLSMNGRAVFNFALKEVPPQIKNCASMENIDLIDIDAFLLHQGSYAIVDAISRSFPNLKSKFLKDIEHTGNTVSSSIPLLLEKYYFNGQGDCKLLLISGFGVGLSIGTMILTDTSLK